MTETEKAREFLDWLDLTRENRPSEFKDTMSLHEARLLYEKMKQEGKL